MFKEKINRLKNGFANNKIIKRGVSDADFWKEKLVIFHKRFYKFIPIPIALGIVASFLMIRYYGWAKFFEQVLSWVIGITIVTIGVSTILNKINTE